MPVDEFQLRDKARELAHHYAQLEEMKHTRHAPPEVRVMKPAPGPQAPGNWLYMATAIDQAQRLREVAFNALADVGVKLRDDDARAVRLCELLAFHAQAIAALDWADDLADELESQARIINRRCNPPETRALAGRPEPRHGSEYVARQLRARGHHITADTIRGWARHGHISRTVMPNGRGGYRLTEALTWAERKDTP